VADDQVADNPKGGVKEPGTSSGNELANDKGREPGRKAEGKDGADRPVGGRDSRDSTSINSSNEKSKSGKDMPPA
jgi:hypothetical protein